MFISLICDAVDNIPRDFQSSFRGIIELRASLAAQTGKNLPAVRETWVQSLGREDPRRREWLPTPVFLPGEFYGQRRVRATVHVILQARILEWVAIPFSGDLPNPGIEPRSPSFRADSLLAEPQGKPKNTGVCSLSLSRGSS